MWSCREESEGFAANHIRVTPRPLELVVKVIFRHDRQPEDDFIFFARSDLTAIVHDNHFTIDPPPRHLTGPRFEPIPRYAFGSATLTARTPAGVSVYGACRLPGIFSNHGYSIRSVRLPTTIPVAVAMSCAFSFPPAL